MGLGIVGTSLCVDGSLLSYIYLSVPDWYPGPQEWLAAALYPRAGAGWDVRARSRPAPGCSLFDGERLQPGDGDGRADRCTQGVDPPAQGEPG